MKPILKFSICAAAAIAVMGGISAADAATLTAVPMQGGMVMPSVSYSAADGRLHVAMPADVPQLTPLLVSNPADQFDPADPWFQALDPSRDGAAFSRRYGFVMDAVSDPLPGGTQMWLRKLAGPLELKFYRYAASAPKAFEPIFGTDGVTNAMFWSGTMFHPTVTAPPGTNGYSATFEVFLRNATTGAEVPGSSSGPLVLTWTNVPDGRPALSADQKIVIAWPESTATNWVLEVSPVLSGAPWTPVTNRPVMINGQRCVVLDRSAGQTYFRTRFVP